MEEGKAIGKIFSYYSKIGVAAIELENNLSIGDTIEIRGHTTNFQQKVESMQIEGKNVKKATKGQSVGIKVKDRVRPSDVVYKV